METAVEFLIKNQKHNTFFNIEIIEKAIQIEKEQLQHFYNKGVEDDYYIDYETFIKYYYDVIFNK